MLTSLIKSYYKVIILCTKYGAENLIDAEFVPKTKFKMAAASILNLFPVAIFDILPTFRY